MRLNCLPAVVQEKSLIQNHVLFSSCQNRVEQLKKVMEGTKHNYPEVVVKMSKMFHEIIYETNAFHIFMILGQQTLFRRLDRGY